MRFLIQLRTRPIRLQLLVIFQIARHVGPFQLLGAHVQLLHGLRDAVQVLQQDPHVHGHVVRVIHHLHGLNHERVQELVHIVLHCVVDALQDLHSQGVLEDLVADSYHQHLRPLDLAQVHFHPVVQNDFALLLDLVVLVLFAQVFDFHRAVPPSHAALDYSHHLFSKHHQIQFLHVLHVLVYVVLRIVQFVSQILPRDHRFYDLGRVL